MTFCKFDRETILNQRICRSLEQRWQWYTNVLIIPVALDHINKILYAGLFKPKLKKTK